MSYQTSAQCGLDIFIANDQSGSVDGLENLQSRYFITELMRNIEPWGTANNESRMAVAQWDDYGTWQQYVFPQANLNFTTELSDIIAFQYSSRIMSGWTDPKDALIKTTRAINKNPIKDRRVNKIIVLMTDADCVQIQSDIVQLADQIKREGVYIMVLAIDNAQRCNILKDSNVASPGGYFSADSYEELYNKAIDYAKSIAQQACNFPPPPPPAFDLTIQIDKFNLTNCQVDGTGGVYSTNYTVKNIGDTIFENTLKISFYDDKPTLASANLLTVQSLNNIKIPIDGVYTNTLTSNSFKNTTRLYAVVNFDGNASLPLPNDIISLAFVTPEKITNNNFSNRSTIISDASCKPRAIINTSVGHTGIGCDSTITYNIELCNTGNATAFVDDFQTIAPSQFVLKENKSLPSDVDLQKVWSTYFGGELNERINKVAIDDEGNVYIVGHTESLNNISTVDGFQTNRISNSSGFIAKFSNQGDIIWSTYFGKNSVDEVFALDFDNEGNLYVAGKIANGNTHIITPDIQQPIYGGYESDGVLAKFSKDGVRLWATYYGGFEIDQITTIQVDKDNNVYIAGLTGSGYNSMPNRIATEGTYRGIHFIAPDGFLAKFNSDGIRQWGTYFGGEKFDIINSIAVDDQLNIFVAGHTNSLPVYVTTAGAHQTTFGGSTNDAVLAKFDKNGKQLWSTYYGGEKHEQANDLAVDSKGNVYMSGITQSTVGISSDGSHQSNYSGNGDVFLAKFNTNGVRQWATYYGGVEIDRGNGLFVDEYGYVYISGFTFSDIGISTNDNYQSIYAGKGDAFLAKFNEYGIRQWGTYFGGNEIDGASSVVLDKQGNIYLAGHTNSPNDIITPGAYQTVLGSYDYNDVFITKFAPGKGFPIAPNSCKNFQYSYYVGNANPNTYDLSVGFTAKDQNPTLEFPSIILPDNNFNVGGFTNLNGFNGGNHTSDNVIIPVNLSSACAPGDKISTAVSISSSNTCGNEFAQATFTINNTSGVDILNTFLEFNLTGTGAAFAGEMYNISSNLSYEIPFVLHADYPNIANALYTKTGIVRIPLWKLPAGTTTFNIDVKLGAPTTILSVKIDNINTNYNETGQSNTATLSQAVTVPANATITGFTCPASITAGNNITFSGISTTNASSIKWASSSVANIPNTGTISNPGIIYAPTPKDIANSFVAISLTALNSNGCETTRSCQVKINNVVYDYGDAPMTYDLNKNIQPYAGSSTLHNSIYLGTTQPGTENTAKNSANAIGDGNEEDGLVSSCGANPVNLQPYALTVQATNNSINNAFISGFIDWNNDGDYLDDGESVLKIVQANNSSGTKDYILQFIPETANTALDKYFVRLRISTDSNSVKQPYGTAPEGEIEDHQMELGTASTFTNPQSICQGSSYSINGKNYTIAGTYRDTLTNAAVGGCDSIIITNLTITSASTFTNPQSICQGSSYSINGKNYTIAGTYRDTLKNAAVGGCDSIIITNLSVLEYKFTNIKDTICNGASLTIGGQTYTASGIYQIDLKSVGGCDSTVNLELTVADKILTNIKDTICTGSSLTIGGQTFTTSGTYQIDLKSVGGCDSTVNLELFVTDKILTNIKDTICNGASLTIGGQTFTASGIYQIDLKSVGGCDSTVNLELTVADKILTNIKDTICTGSSLTIGGQTFTTSGTYQIDLKSVGGCDSTVNLELTVADKILTNIKDTICTGSSLTIGGQTFNSSGTYQIDLKSVGGCDSTVNLDLLVTNKIITNIKDTICTGGSLTIGGQIFTSSGTYQIDLKSIGGCDSTVNLELTVTDKIITNLRDTICTGGSLTIGGQTFNSSGTYQIDLKSVGGCDSTVNLDLLVTNKIITNIKDTICTGGSLTIGGQIFTSSGTYQIDLKSVGGCDSTVNLELTVTDKIITNLRDTICTGGSLTIGGQTFTTLGIYQIDLKSIGGCDSTVNLELTVTDKIITNLRDTICTGGSLTIGGQIFTSSGTYQIDLKSIGGCDSTVNLELIVESDTSTNYYTLEECENEFIELKSLEDYSIIEWNDFSKDEQLEVYETGMYWLKSQKDCTIRIDTFNVKLNQCGCDVFFPKAFSPNQDGVNDVFRPIQYSTEHISLKIFNRWGNCVFDSDILKSYEWDGRHNNIEMPMDTYIYHYYGKCEDDSFKNYSGHVTIVR